MPLQTSGAISLSDIQAEFGGSNPISLSEYYRGGSYVPDTPTNSGVPTSGQISLSDFYGAANSEPLSLSSSGGSNTEYSSTCRYVHAIGTVTASGGTAPYTYSWTKISGTPSIWSGSSTDTLNVREYMCPDASASGVFRCTVTDAANTTETIDVTFSLFIVNLN